MTSETDFPVEDSILEVLRDLGIERSHFAARGLNDWLGVASRYPEAVASLTLVCPLGFDSRALAPLTNRLLVFNGDSGGASQTIARNLADLPSANSVTLADCPFPDNYNDMAVHRDSDLAPPVLSFLERMQSGGSPENVTPSRIEGEVDGVYYRVQGSGPPLVLLPLGAAPSQWDPSSRA